MYGRLKEWYFNKVRTMSSDLLRLAMKLLFDSDNRADLMKNRYLPLSNYSQTSKTENTMLIISKINPQAKMRNFKTNFPHK